MAGSSNSLAVITRAALVYQERTASATDLADLALRVDAGVISMPTALVGLSESATRATGSSDELARLFFILFGRAPDLNTFQAGMGMLRAGTHSLVDLCQIGLGMSSSVLSDSYNYTNSQFVLALANQILDPTRVALAYADIAGFTTQLNLGMLTRPQLLARMASYDFGILKYSDKVDPALMYLAGAGREASAAELAASQGVTPLVLAQQVLDKADLLAYGTAPFFSFSGDTVSVSGTTTGDFSINLATKASSLSAKSNYKLFYSVDGGTTDSSAQFTSALIAGVDNVDASQMSGPPKTFTAVASASGSRITAPLGSVATLNGGSGDDTLVGGSGKDVITGGGGDDVLKGNDGDDAMYAGAGFVTMNGGAGKDTFYMPSATSLRASGGLVTIEDFGNGGDVLNLGILDGNIKPANAKLLVGASDRASGFIDLTKAVNNSIILVNNTGTWVDTAATGDEEVDLARRTEAEIASLFTSDADGTPVTFATVPLYASTYYLFSYDALNGADLWMVSNLSDLLNVTASEARLIGHLSLSDYGDLWTALQVSGAIVS